MTKKDIELLSFSEDAVYAIKDIIEIYQTIRSHSYTKYEERSAKKRLSEYYKNLLEALKEAEKAKAEYDAEELKRHAPFSETEIEEIVNVVEDYVKGLNDSDLIVEPKVKKNKLTIAFKGELRKKMEFAEKNIATYVYEKCKCCGGTSFENGILTVSK